MSMRRVLLLPLCLACASAVLAQTPAAPARSSAAYSFTPDPDNVSPEAWRRKAAALADSYAAAGGGRRELLESALVSPYLAGPNSLDGLSPSMKEVLAAREKAALPALTALLDALKLYECGRSTFGGDPQSELVYAILGQDYARTLPSRRRILREGSGPVKLNVARETLRHAPRDPEARRLLKAAPMGPAPGAVELPTDVAWSQDFSRTSAALKPPAKITPGKPNRYEVTLTNSGTHGVTRVVSYLTLPPGTVVLARSGESVLHSTDLKWLYDAVGPGASRTEWAYLQLSEGYSPEEHPVRAGIGDFNRGPGGTISIVTVSEE